LVSYASAPFANKCGLFQHADDVYGGDVIRCVSQRCAKLHPFSSEDQKNLIYW